ncbi:hypothetical protein [Phenylobacterium sp.]|uniref:hypothetical protein n=1 Tax=Phenylobacterium sp. TaxID=1871053 RepID=UPI0025D086A9|nr:hypothetical protein [Phenylobacterium sp.]
MSKYQKGGFLSSVGDFAKSEEGKALIASLLQRAATKKSQEAGQGMLESEGRTQMESGKQLYEAMLDKLRKEDFVSQAQRDVATDTKEAAEAFVEATRRRGDESAASTIDALRADPRMAALAPKQARAIEQNIQQAELLGLDKKVAADKAVADLEQQGLGFQRQLDLQEMRRGGLGAEAGRQMMLDAMLQQAQAGPMGTQAGINTGIAVLGALSDYSDIANQNPSGSIVDVEEEDDNLIGGLLGSLNEVDVPAGEEGMKTNGEFSHDRNPKAIIDEDTGVKEGEVTGGELIFNPKQSNTMEELIEKEDAEGLLSYLKDLLSQPQFQA